MTGIRHLMTDDHRHCDELFVQVEEAIDRREFSRARELFTAFTDAMLAHFACEESRLFPAFEAHTGMTSGPTEMMRREHAQLRELLDEAGAALHAGKIAAYVAEADILLILMQQHNMKEENILYPMCDQHMPHDTGLKEHLQTCLHLQKEAA